jgi:hypothetical protein
VRKFVALLSAAVAGLVLAAPATAATATLFGAASQDGNQVRLVSDFSTASTADDSSGINFTDTGVTTFASLQTLATKFNVNDDDCGGGSPRFQINFGTQNVFVYLGPSPTFTGCTQNTLVDSGNLIGNNDACRWDTSQIQAGTQCNTYAGALALLGSMTVTGIQLVVDGGWSQADKEQTLNVCDIRINQHTFFPCAGTTPPPTVKNASQACRQQRAQMGDEAFRMMWGTNINKRNAFGKCVSTMNKAKKNAEARELQTDVLTAVAACKAEGKTGSALGTCVKSRVNDDIAEAVKAKKTSKAKGKGKKKP